jgi:glycosyltransferase involved in cell wall biosynthesis
LGPYHYARFRRLSQYLDLKIIPVPYKENYRPWAGYKKEFEYMDLFKGQKKLSGLKKRRKLLNFLEKERPVAVICTGYDFLMRFVGRFARSKNILAVLVMVSWEGNKDRSFFREYIKRWLVQRSFDAVLVPGTRSANYARHLGFGDKKIYKCGNVVDNDKFMATSGNIKDSKKDVQKEKYLPKNYFLYVGRLSPEKNLRFLIKSFTKYRKMGGEWKLVIIGEGNQYSSLKRLVNKLDSSQDVLFQGWRQQKELIYYYTFAKCFILPSVAETWGLVVNEAMACGLPIIVSNACGCIPELCHDNVNGYVFNPYNENELVNLMMKVSEKNKDLEYMGESSQQIISQYNLTSWAKTVANCVEKNL